MENQALLRHPAMRTLEKAFKREALLQLGASCLLFLFGLILTGLQFGNSVILSILGLGACVISIGLILKSLSLIRKQKHPVLEILRKRPYEVVWVYTIITERMPFGLQFVKNGLLYIHLIDGTHHSVSLPARKLKLVSKYLNRLLPNACFGYSEEREQTYLQNPEKLMRKK